MIQNNGQVCGAQSRVLVPRTSPAIKRDLADLFDRLKPGDPRDGLTDVGPVATVAQATRVTDLTQAAMAGGARRLGGTRGASGGCLVDAALLEVDADNVIAREEVFGPVTSLIEYDTVDQAVEIANAHPYGLSGSVWSPDRERSVGVARRMRCGTVGIGSKRILDFAAPFGGHRSSGIGRELGPEGIDGYLETTTIIIP